MTGRRVTALALGVLSLVLPACSNSGSDDERETAADRTPTTAASPLSSSPSADDALECEGIGTVPVEGQITIVRRGVGLFAVGESNERCLLSQDDAALAAWAPTGNRVLLDRSVHYASGRQPTDAPDADVQWSRPGGRSFIGLADGGGLTKWPADDAAAEQEINSPVDHPDALAYHPAGRHLAMSGRRNDTYGVYLTTNTGAEPRLVTKGESARRITELAFSQDGERLYFVADHGSEQHLHRLDLNVGRVETLDMAESIANLHVSAIGGVAWQTGACEKGTTATVVMRRDTRLELPPDVKAARVIGWMPDQSVIFENAFGCGTNPSHSVMRWTPGHSVLTVVERSEDVSDTDVRIAYPAPPGPPPSRVFDIPESAAPA